MTDEQAGKLISDVQYIRENLESKADKWVEKAMTGMISMILLAFMGAIIGLVFVPNARGIAQFYLNLIA